MRDFTVKKYLTLLESLQKQDFSFQRFDEFIAQPKAKSIVLRHDVDLLPFNSLQFAKIQKEKNICGTYYFRIIPASFNEKVIKEIAGMGHEIGYHYEDLTISNGDIEKAYDSFCKNLEVFRKLYPVKTICMHGSPMSKWDSKDIWKKYDYKKLGIIGEPYFDINFNKVFYITDTGRRWNGDKFSIRDKVDSTFDLSFQYTHQIIQAANDGVLPNKIMFTFHPQRWNDKYFEWFKELIIQNIKNIIKQILVKHK